MKKMYNRIISSINYNYFSLFSYVLLIIWALTPIIEYLLKSYMPDKYTFMFCSNIYLIGFLGIIEYVIYLCKIIKDKKFNIKDMIPQILILILLILSIISSVLANNPYLSFFVENYRKEGLIVYIMYIGFALSASLIKDKKYIKNVFILIILSAIFITIMPLFKNDFTYTNFSNIYHNINHYGYFLMISTVLAGFMYIDTKGIKKIVYLLIYIMLIHMFIRSNTFGCFLSIAICFLFSLIYSLICRYKRKNIVVLIVIFIVSSALISHFDIKIGEKINLKNRPGIVSNNITSFSNDIKTLAKNDSKSNIDNIGSGRWLLWKEAVVYISKNPFVGGGMECLKSYYNNNDIKIDRPHNIILQVASFIGIPGAIIYLILIIYLAIINLKRLKNDSLNFIIYITAMSYFISSNFGNSMYYTSPYFMILIGLLIGMFNNNKDVISN